MFAFIAFGISILLLIVILTVKVMDDMKAMEKMESEIRAKYGLNDIFVGDDRSFIGFGFDAKQIVLGKGAGCDKAYSFSQITSVAVVEDGITTTSTNRGSQLMGGAVGGLAFGEIGAVVGALSASTRSICKVRSMSLKVTVDDRIRPAHSICFFDLSERGAGGPLATSGRAKIERFHAHTVNVMRQARQEEAKQLPF